MARIKAALRRAELPPPVQALPDLQACDLAIHFQNQEVTVGGKQVKLTPVEYMLLYHLIRNRGHLLPHQALLDRMWGGDYDASPEYLRCSSVDSAPSCARRMDPNTSRRSVAVDIAFYARKKQP
jgi:two-component system, OmpR family, KDP operon response regulator KdpE